MKRTVSAFNGVLKTRFEEVYSDILRLYSDQCAGSGGRGAGSINRAGGAFKNWEVAKEAQYFHKKERELLEKIKGQMNEQLEFHKKQIALHQESMEDIKRKQKEIKP